MNITESIVEANYLAWKSSARHFMGEIQVGVFYMSYNPQHIELHDVPLISPYSCIFGRYIMSTADMKGCVLSKFDKSLHHPTYCLHYKRNLHLFNIIDDAYVLSCLEEL